MDWHTADIVHREEWGQQPAEEEERSCSTRKNKEDGQVEAKADGEWNGLVKDGDWHGRGERWKDAERRIPSQLVQHFQPASIER